MGLMSGTCLDGIDAALVDLNHPQLIARHYTPFDDALKSELLALHQPCHNELHRTQLAGNLLAHRYAAAINSLLASANVSNTKIVAIGCHGQTIRHCPELGYTLQIGNAALLAELTGITVVNNFRSRDIAAGGQGAPLVPAFHNQILRHPVKHRVIVNIGGIANLTNLPPNAPTTGFDCGPGNLLMDAWCMQHLGKPYDQNGAWAASGRMLPALLKKMQADPFFTLLPPKSCGRDLFNMAWLNDKLQGTELAEDVETTLLELTCRTIAKAIRQYCKGAAEIYLCGGGAHNLTLSQRLGLLLPDSSIQSTDVLGVSGDYLEATAFAWLAQQAMRGKPANLPLVTGATHSCVLGAIHPA